MAEWPIGKSEPAVGDRLTGDAAGNVLVTQRGEAAVVLYNSVGCRLKIWQYTSDGRTLIPSGIAPVGAHRLVVLFPEAKTAAILSTAK